MSAWEPIESAPLGLRALFWNPVWTGPLIGQRDGDRTFYAEGHRMSGVATHWQPLPPPPEVRT